MTGTGQLETKHGTISFPAYVPVTTFGEKYPLDDLIRPYLPRLAQAVMVSYHYAKKMIKRPKLPLMIDSGGFASLFKGAKIRRKGSIGLLKKSFGDNTETIHPKDVLEFQERHADVAFTLDFPIPPKMARREAKRRLELTIANAHWALENRRSKDMLLYACIQGWDENSVRKCAESYARAEFDGVALGGLVPRVRDLDQIERWVKLVKEVVGDKPLHVFGLGKPEIVSRLFLWGVDSIDSSSYVKLAVEGRLWQDPTLNLTQVSPIERLQVALCNLAKATNSTFPLSASPPTFKTFSLVR